MVQLQLSFRLVKTTVCGEQPTRLSPVKETSGSSFTTISIVWEPAHCPEFGVKLYVLIPAVVVAMADGDQVPTMPSCELEGRAAATSLIQNGPSWLN